MDNERPGLSRRELEHEARWLLKQVQSRVDPPTKAVVENIVDVVITLIDKNNAELARFFEDRGLSDARDDF